jgi:hypothetical protein
MLASPAGTPLEIMALTGISTAPWSLVRFDGHATEILGTYDQPVGESQGTFSWADGAYRRNGEAIVSTGYEDVLWWRNGQLDRVSIARTEELKGVRFVPGFGVVVLAGALTSGPVYRLPPGGSTFERITDLPRFGKSVAPFRGGWIVAIEGGLILHKPPDAPLCPEPLVSLELGTDTPRVLVEVAPEVYLADMPTGTAAIGTPDGAYLRPMPPEPPPEGSF